MGARPPTYTASRAAQCKLPPPVPRSAAPYRPAPPSRAALVRAGRIGRALVSLPAVCGMMGHPPNSMVEDKKVGTAASMANSDVTAAWVVEGCKVVAAISHATGCDLRCDGVTATMREVSRGRWGFCLACSLTPQPCIAPPPTAQQLSTQTAFQRNQDAHSSPQPPPTTTCVLAGRHGRGVRAAGPWRLSSARGAVHHQMAARPSGRSTAAGGQGRARGAWLRPLVAALRWRASGGGGGAAHAAS